MVRIYGPRLGAVVLGLGLVLPATAAPGQADDGTATLVADAMSDAGVVGLSLARLRNGQVVEARGFGLAAIGGPVVGPDTVFQAASIGKVAAAYAALILVEQGRLKLDQRLTDPRIDVPEGCAVPTVRAVLKHASGMSNDLTALRFRTSCPADDTFRYSGQGFLALATEIERAGGRPAAELIAALVFEPLGMKNTRFGPAANTDDRARGHVSWTAFAVGQAIGNPLGVIGSLVIMAFLLLMVVLPLCFGVRHGWRTGTGAWLLALFAVLLLAELGVRRNVEAEREVPADRIPASLTTTAADMSRLASELLSPRLLSGTTAHHLLGPVTSVSSCIGWSLVMGTDRCGGQATAWQWGSNLGFQSLLVLAPESGDGVVILTNTGGGIDAVLPNRGGYPAAKRIASEVLGIEGRWDLRD